MKEYKRLTNNNLEEYDTKKMSEQILLLEQLKNSQNNSVLR